MHGERACFRGSEIFLGHTTHQIGSLACGFCALQSRISRKIYSKPVMHASSPCEVLDTIFIESFQHTVLKCVKM